MFKNLKKFLLILILFITLTNVKPSYAVTSDCGTDYLSSFISPHLIIQEQKNIYKPININADTLDNLRTSVEELDVKDGIKQSLISKLNRADKLIKAKNYNYINVLKSFINQVNFFKENIISAEQADELINSTNEIINLTSIEKWDSWGSVIISWIIESTSFLIKA